MSLWPDLDELGRGNYLDELASRGVFPASTPDLTSPVEPVWKDANGAFVREDGTPLPVVTLTDPAGIDSRNWIYWALGAAAVLLIAS